MQSRQNPLHLLSPASGSLPVRIKALPTTSLVIADSTRNACLSKPMPTRADTSTASPSPPPSSPSPPPLPLPLTPSSNISTKTHHGLERSSKPPPRFVHSHSQSTQSGPDASWAPIRRPPLSSYSYSSRSHVNTCFPPWPNRITLTPTATDAPNHHDVNADEDYPVMPPPLTPGSAYISDEDLFFAGASTSAAGDGEENGQEGLHPHVTVSDIDSEAEKETSGCSTNDDDDGQACAEIRAEKPPKSSKRTKRRTTAKAPLLPPLLLPPRFALAERRKKLRRPILLRR